MSIPVYAMPDKKTANVGEKIKITCAVYDNRYYYYPYFNVFCNDNYIEKTEHKMSTDGSYAEIEYIIPDVTDSYGFYGKGCAEFKFIMRDYWEHDYSYCEFTVSVPFPEPPSLETSGETVGTYCSIRAETIYKAFRCEIKANIRNNNYSLASFNYDDCVHYDDSLLLGGVVVPGGYYDYEWLLNYSLSKLFKNQKEENCTISIDTFVENKYYKSTSIQIRLKVPENDITKPAISSVELSPITSCTDALAPLYIRGKTGLNAKISATSEYSNIAEYEVTAGSVCAKGNPGIIDVLANDGNVSVTVKVTDARGFSRTVTQNIYVYPYSRPKIVPYTGYSDIVCERAKATGELHSDGTYLAIMAGKRFTSIMKDGTELNRCTLRYRFKPTTTDIFGDWVTLLADGSAESEIQVLAGNVVSNTSASYDIELSVIDAVGGEHTIRFPVMTSAISFVLYDGVDGAAFGKYPEEPHVVDIAAHMTLRVRGRLEVLGASWASLGLADGMEESPYAYGRQDDTGCYYQVSNGNHVQVAFNCSYNYAGRSQVINLTPIPEEYRPERTVCSICPTNDRRLALVTVQPDGYIRIEWVQTIASTSNTSSATVLWVDGYLDYWV